MMFLVAYQTYGAKTFKADNSEDVLAELQGNNYNIYLVNFFESETKDEKTKSNMKDIEKRLGGILNENPEFYSVNIDLSNKSYFKLASSIDIPSAPAVLMIVHGKGVWVTGVNPALLDERIRDFIPSFKEASTHHTNPTNW